MVYFNTDITKQIYIHQLPIVSYMIQLVLKLKAEYYFLIAEKQYGMERKSPRVIHCEALGISQKHNQKIKRPAETRMRILSGYIVIKPLSFLDNGFYLHL